MEGYVGIDIGGTEIKYGLIELEGTIHNQNQQATVYQKNDLYQVLEKIVDDFRNNHTILGVGISVPGIVTETGKMKTAGIFSFLVGVEFKQELETLFNLPVAVENDANAAILAENFFGVAKEHQTSVMVTVGTGIGGGVIINNRLHRGFSNRAGEFGFMLLDPVSAADTKSPSFSKVGALPSLYHYYFVQSNHYVADGKKIFELAATGDQFAQKAIERFTMEVTKGLYNLVMCMDPEIIIIGGAISDNPTFMDALNQKMGYLFQAHDELSQLRIPSIIPAHFRNSAGILGAITAFI